MNKSFACIVWRTRRHIWFTNNGNDRRRLTKEGTGTCKRVDGTESERITWNVGQSEFEEIAAFMSGVFL